MSKFESGIMGRASGKLSGIIFSRARTRRGKVMTARELVIPTNPRTHRQQANRALHRMMTETARELGRQYYNPDWDNSLGQNAGFPSLVSHLRRAYKGFTITSAGDGAAMLSEVSEPVSLGNLHFPQSVTTSRSGSDYAVSWSTENGVNGSGADQVIVVLNRNLFTLNSTFGANIVISTDAVRADGSVSLNMASPASTPPRAYQMLIYFRSELEEPGHLSEARFFAPPN